MSRNYNWISNGDPPMYVWENDLWFNQKDKKLYEAIIEIGIWIDISDRWLIINFPKKTKIMGLR